MIVGGTGDDDDEPTWPGEESADRAIRLIGEGLVALHASLEGGARGADDWCRGGRRAPRRPTGRCPRRGLPRHRQRRTATVRSLVDAVTTLPAGFRDLVGALGEGATITVDPAWAEAPDGEGGGADA